MLVAAALACSGEPHDGAEQASKPRIAREEIASEFEDGVALAIVYDTSGSMEEAVADANGGATAKYVVANRALESVIARLEQYVQGATEEFPRPLDVGLVRFQGTRATIAVPFGPFDPVALRRFAAAFDDPEGSTPLGRAVELASREVLRSPRIRKHVIVITDGRNTDGPTPETILRDVDEITRAAGVVVRGHFVAFDVDAKVFDGVRGFGADVVPAANAIELDARLADILDRQVLLEAEDPPAAPDVSGR